MAFSPLVHFSCFFYYRWNLFIPFFFDIGSRILQKPMLIDLRFDGVGFFGETFRASAGPTPPFFFGGLKALSLPFVPCLITP